MNEWLHAIHTCAQQEVAAILITVAGVEGSAPREPGAKMVVTATAQFDTIGGGHLEMQACVAARGMLARPTGLLSASRHCQRFALGPSLGQCCGGIVHLAFERVDGQAAMHFIRLAELWHQRKDCWRMVALDAATPPRLLDPDHPLPFDHAQPCRVIKDESGFRWLVDPCMAQRPHLLLFGAGHVGAAVVRALAELPCDLTWVDERDDIFPSDVPAHVRVEVTNTPEAVVTHASAGTSFLVMTHSHALDQRLCEAILRRNDARWFGLIGSRTKRMHFEHRLRERGLPAEWLSRMTCPIGISGISGKAPAVIAASVAAQLLQAWEPCQPGPENSLLTPCNMRKGIEP